MENSLYIALSRQVALQQRMSIVANNIANINTPGFKAEKMIFEEYLVTPEATGEQMSMVMDYGQFTVQAQGPLKLTGNPLDIGLEGDGFMMVETPEGTQYTRAGNFSLNANGELVTAAGYRVLNDGEGPIVIPADAREIKISHQGEISTDEGVIGKLGVVEFANMQELQPAGNGLYKAPEGGATPSLDTKVLQNMLEGSNVKGVLEMTDMIEISRQYQSTQKLLQSEHERQRNVIQKLSDTQA